MPVTLNDAKRLKEAGFPQDIGYWSMGDCKFPDDGELMEYLKQSRELDYVSWCDGGWVVHLHLRSEPIINKDLTSALVEACIRVVEQKKREGK